MYKLFLAVFTLLVCSLGALSQAKIVAIKAGTVVDPATGTSAKNQIILIEGRDIKAIGADVKIPDGATIIDLSTKTVLPGMMDAHTHLCMNMQHKRDANSYYITTLRDSDAARAIQGMVNAKSMLEAGFTAVRDVGNEGNYACSEVRNAIDQGQIPGPHIINAGRIIAPYGGQFQLQPDKQGLAEPEYFFADTRDEMKKAIRQNIHYGARVIKIVVDDQRYIYSVEDIKFMIAETHAVGLKFAAHCWTRQGARNAAEAGVDSIEHAVQIDDETLDIAKKNNVAIVPIPFTEIDATLGGEPGSNKWASDNWFIDPVKRAYKKGVTMVWGPDIIFTTRDNTRGSLSIGTVDNWVEAGIPAATILQTLTTNAAKLLGIEKTRGALKPGMRADIIAVNDNPLEKITTLKNVVFVMRGGIIYKK
ncbi:MAG TPA: amidohydrolase family protein [Pyrinomonadaceae bacterium]|nr:amidohydrolase family protein [Pyrinomonadaceae bacterium]